MFDRQREALNPAAVDINRAGRISGSQRLQLSARATGAALGWVSMTVFAAIAWWFVLIAETRWLAGPGLIATVGSPIALWALYRIVADLRSGRVVAVTGRAIILREVDHESHFRIRLEGRQFRVPYPLANLLHQTDNVTAFFTPWSDMLVNLTPAEADS